MQDPFSQVVDDSAVGNDDDDALMTRATDSPMSPPSSATANQGARSAATGKNSRQPLSPSEFAGAARSKLVCPFCGSINARDTEEHGEAPPCPKCMMQDTATTRQATKVRIGPWFVRQTRNPAAPGMRFDTLLSLVKRAQISPGSVVRGPTTHQLWKFAAQVKGLSREFGLCYSCGGAIEQTATICPACSRMQEPPVNPDVLLESPAQMPPSPALMPPALQKPTPVPQHAPAPMPQAPPVAPASTKPTTPDLTGVRTRGSILRRGEEVLTARELAAAFQLDFVPANERSKAGGWQRPRRLGRKIALVALLLLVAGAVGALIKRPDWRSNASAWAAETYASVKDVVASASANSNSSDAPKKPAPAPPPSIGEDPLDHASVSSGSLRVTAPTQPDDETTTAARPPAPETLPVEKVPLTVPPSSAQTPRPTDAGATAPTEERNATSPNSSSMSAADQLDQARALYRQGIDAERKRPADYAEAVRLYEKVKKLPREVWPGDLEIRLERARRSMK